MLYCLSGRPQTLVSSVKIRFCGQKYATCCTGVDIAVFFKPNISVIFHFVFSTIMSGLSKEAVKYVKDLKHLQRLFLLASQVNYHDFELLKLWLNVTRKAEE